MRALQQQVTEAEVTVVTTPQQLLDAVDNRSKHIEIREHLDLTTVQPEDTGGHELLGSPLRPYIALSIKVRWYQPGLALHHNHIYVADCSTALGSVTACR